MFEWLLLHTVVTALLAVAVCVLIRRFRPGPAARHALWLVVLLKLLTPPFVAWPWALPRWPEPPAAPRTQDNTPPPPADDAPALAAGDEIAEATELPVVASPPVEGLVPVAAAAPAFSLREWLPRVAAAVWLAGGLVILWRQAVRLERLRRLLALTGDAPAALQETVRAAAARQGVWPPLIAVVPGLASPAVWGLRRTRLLWPQGLEETLSPPGLRAVLAHELAHLRRRDHWVGWLLLLGECVWWWHPLFRLVRRRLGQEAEQACDARAVEEAPESRRDYAEALVAVVERMARPAEARPALGAASDRRDVERRIIMILNGTKAGGPARRWLLAAGLLAVLALPAWTLGQPQDEDRKEPPPVVAPAPATDLVEPAPVEDAKDAKVRELEDRRRAVVKELVAELMKKYNALYKQAKYAEAAHVALQARQLDPDNPVLMVAAEIARRQVGIPPGTGGMPVPAMPPVAVEPHVPYGPVVYYEPVTTYRDGRPVTTYILRHSSGTPREEIQLSRVTYKLPADKAKAMAALLAEVKATVMEIKVDGDRLIVTTTPEAQRTVAQLIELLLARPGESGRAPYSPAPPAALVPPTEPVGPYPPAPLPSEPVSPPPVAPPPIPAYPPVAAGSIKTVDEKTGLVLLSIGSDAGLKEGTTLLVYRGTRGPKCLGSVQIIKVTATEAVAKPAAEMTEKPTVGDWLLHGTRSL